MCGVKVIFLYYLKYFNLSWKIFRSKISSDSLLLYVILPVMPLTYIILLIQNPFYEAILSVSARDNSSSKPSDIQVLLETH